jgi:hypothetical protein
VREIEEPNTEKSKGEDIVWGIQRTTIEKALGLNDFLLRLLRQSLQLYCRGVLAIYLTLIR